MQSLTDELAWGAGRGSTQRKRAGQMSQAHMPFISHCAWKNRNAGDARKMWFDLKSAAPTLTHCNI